MKKILIPVIIIAVVVLAALPRILPMFQSSGEKPNAGGPGGGPVGQQQILPVEMVVIRPEAFERKLVVTGSILPSESVEIKSEISGKVTAISFQESQRVIRGMRLAKINDEELLAQLEKQKYNRKLFQDNEYRQRKLLEKEAISQEEYDNALNRLRTTEADVKVLETQIAKTSVLAPFDGFIGFRFISPGAFISPSTVIATLYSLDPAKIEFSIPARYASRVALGNQINFKPENSDSLAFNGKVYAIEPQIDAKTRTLKIRATTPNPGGRLIPGMFVSIELILEKVDAAILVPTEAVIPVQDGAKVFVMREGKAVEVPVVAGERTARQLEVTAGLQAGDSVITTGILQLRPGMNVKPTRVN